MIFNVSSGINLSREFLGKERMIMTGTLGGSKEESLGYLKNGRGDEMAMMRNSCRKSGRNETQRARRAVEIRRWGPDQLDRRQLVRNTSSARDLSTRD